MSPYLKKSLVLHFIVLLAFVIELPLFWRNKDTMGQVPIIVDLNQVKISEMTNLPPKAEFGKEEQSASQVKRKIEDSYTKDEVVEDVKQDTNITKEKEVAEEKTEAPKNDFLEAPKPAKKPVKKVETKKAPKPVAKPKNKPKPKKQEKGKPELANPLKSLLASVDALDKVEGNKSAKAIIKEGTEVANMGIDGGTGGSYFSELSVSEIDAIAGRLRACWNLDPGAMGIEDMIVEIRAYLNQDGSVKKVDILDSSRYNSDTHFRSVADSAKRAVYVCGPYKIFANKYADKYDMWKTMLLRFNPFDASIN